jgi:hypothetical protein
MNGCGSYLAVVCNAMKPELLCEARTGTRTFLFYRCIMSVNPLSEDTMNILKTCAAALLGFVLGAIIYYPKTVKASGAVRVQEVRAHTLMSSGIE